MGCFWVFGTGGSCYTLGSDDVIMARMTSAYMRAYRNGRLWLSFVDATIIIEADDSPYVSLPRIIVNAVFYGDFSPPKDFSPRVYLRSETMPKTVLIGILAETHTCILLGSDMRKTDLTFLARPLVHKQPTKDVLAVNAGRFLPENAWRYKKIEPDDCEYDQ